MYICWGGAHIGFGIVLMVGVNSPFWLLQYLNPCWISDSQCHLNCLEVHSILQQAFGEVRLSEIKDIMQTWYRFPDSNSSLSNLSFIISVWSWANYVTFFASVLQPQGLINMHLGKRMIWLCSWLTENISSGNIFQSFQRLISQKYKKLYIFHVQLGF